MQWLGHLAERLHDTSWPAPVPLPPQTEAPLVAGWTRHNAEPVGATTLTAWVRHHPAAGLNHPTGHAHAQLADLLSTARVLPCDRRRPGRLAPVGRTGLTMRQAGAQALEVARRHVADAETGHRHHRLVGAVVAPVITGFTDEQTHAAAIALFIGLFNAAEMQHRRPTVEAMAVLAWARRTIGGPAPDLELPRPSWARR